MDDYSNNTAGAGALLLGLRSEGEIETAGDLDWFGITLEGGKDYRIKIQGADTANGTLADPQLRAIYNSFSFIQFEVSDDDSGFGLDSELVFSPSSSGTYYIEAAGFGADTGTYGVIVEEVGPAASEFSVLAINTVKFEGDDTSTLYQFTVSRTGDVDQPASIDWMVNPIIGGDTVNGEDFLGGLLPGGSINFAADQTSQLVSVAVAGDLDEEPDETFSFDLSNASVGSSIAPGAGSKLATILDEDNLGTGSSYVSLVNSSYAYEGQVGVMPFQYLVYRGGDTSIASTVNWSVVPLPSGATVDGDDFEGGVLPVGMVTFEPDETVKAITIYVVGDSDVEGHETFSVVLSNPGANTQITTSGSKIYSAIFDDDEDDFGVLPGDAGKLSLGLPLFGVIGDASDEDWAGVEMEAGKRYAIDLQGFDTFQGTLTDPVIAGVYNGASELQANSSDDNSGSGFNSRLYFIPTEDGTYYVAVAGGGTSGSYRLQVNLDTNNLPTGFVQITGTAQQGEILTASESILDDDGKGPVAYQWYADLVAIDGATSNSLTLGQEQVGKKIYLVASYWDGASNFEQVASTETEVVANVNDAPSGNVTVAGEPKAGETLTAQDNLVDPDGLGVFSYQWYADGAPIAGATDSTYTPDVSVVGQAISVAISYTDGYGSDESVESATTTPVSIDGQLIEGTIDNDSLTGSVGDDTLVGLAGQDTLQGLGGDDQLQGGDGLDTAQYSGELLDYSIVKGDAGITVAGPVNEGTDFATGVERFLFSNGGIAFDLEGNAGLTVRLLATVLGTPGAADTTLRGIGIDIFDNAGLTFEQVMDIALDVVLQPSRSNESVVNLLWSNLVGGSTPQDLLNDLVGALEGGAFTQSALAVTASALLEDLGIIDFELLTLVGVEYQPV